MKVSPLSSTPVQSRLASPPLAANADQLTAGNKSEADVRKAFDSFVGESFFGQLMGAMRKSAGKPAYFHGGRAEEVFQGQLDQMLATKMSEATAGTFSEAMYDLFRLSRS